MKIATWNVNSIRMRLPLVLEWLSLNRPDVMCLQETKVQDAEFPAEAIRSAGYHVPFAAAKPTTEWRRLPFARPKRFCTDCTREWTAKTTASCRPASTASAS